MIKTIALIDDHGRYSTAHADYSDPEEFNHVCDLVRILIEKEQYNMRQQNLERGKCFCGGEIDADGNCISIYIYIMGGKCQ